MSDKKKIQKQNEKNAAIDKASKSKVAKKPYIPNVEGEGLNDSTQSAVW